MLERKKKLTVNPMLPVENTRDHTRPKTPRWVQRASRVEDTYQLGNEERQADAHGCDEGGFVLLLGKHEDGEDQLGGEYGLDEDATHDGRRGRERGAHVEFSGEHDFDQERSEDGAGKLGYDEEDETSDGDGFGH